MEPDSRLYYVDERPPFKSGRRHPINIGGANPNPLPRRARDCSITDAGELTAADYPPPLPDYLL